MTVTESAYAKINLFLDITGRRPDGYHTLSTVMQTISLCDTVTLTGTESGISLACTDPAIPSDSRNLAYKAAELFFRELYDGKGGAEITLEKRIPSQAGLGGGSADAAAVLRGLNRLFGADLSADTLCTAAVKLGADVPFLILGGTALCGGIGEEITLLDDLTDCTIVIAKPGDGVSTKEAYDAFDTAETQGALSHASPQPLVNALKNGKLNDICRSCSNVFEQTVSLAGVNKARCMLAEAGAYVSCMSGSGSAVYGIFGKNFITDNCIKSLKKCELFAVSAAPVDALKLTPDR